MLRQSIMDPVISTNAGETAVCAMSGGDVPDTDQRLQTLSVLARSNLTSGISPKTLSETYHDKDTRTPQTLSGHRQYQYETHTHTAGIYLDKDTRAPQTLSGPKQYQYETYMHSTLHRKIPVLLLWSLVLFDCWFATLRSALQHDAQREFEQVVP